MPHIAPYSDSEIDIATDQAMATLLWAAGEYQNEDGVYEFTWDERFSVDEFSPDQVAAMRAKLQSFMERCLEDLVATGHNAGWENNTGKLAQIGHDYVLTTGGHGAGFWDRGHGEAGDRLSEVCRAERAEWSLYVGDDGKLYCAELQG